MTILVAVSPRSAVLNRRLVLQAAAATAGAAMFGACTPGNDDGRSAPDEGDGARGKGSATKPLPVPSSFSEAPQLAKLVENGELPPVEKRLPENPYVVPHNWVRRGKYGGTIRTMARESSGFDGMNWFYGSSPIRFVNDGLDITGGLFERWEQNEDASLWRFHLRKGLRWSDGEPFTVDDILFWWEDVVLHEDTEDVPPAEFRSGRGTLAEVGKLDELTLELRYDSPAPLTAERIANRVKQAGAARWFVPAHYAKRFHPTYNPDVPDDWSTPEGIFGARLDIQRNPECPTMGAWKLTTYSEGRQVIWERNPYYHVVSPDGDQLPYVDRLIWNVNPETKVGKIDVFAGKVDFQMGQHYGIDLVDIEEFDSGAENAEMERILVDSGSGSGSLVLFNQDFSEARYRELFRDATFRQAISHAIDRKRIQKSVYFRTGFPSTGTLSPKAMEYVVNDEGRAVFENWRDAYVDYDPKLAAKLLDEIGLRKGPDGTRTFADGSELRLVCSFPANAEQVHVRKNAIVVENLKDIGLDVLLDPVSPADFQAQWDIGEIGCRLDSGVSDGPNHLLFPHWLVPVGHQRWAPLQGRWYELRGTKDAEKGVDPDDPWRSTPPRIRPEPGGPIETLHELYDRTTTEPDEMKRTRLVWQMIDVHVSEGPFFIGTVADTPKVVLKKKALRNVPHRDNLAQGGLSEPWIHPTPGVYDPEIFYWEDPENH